MRRLIAASLVAVAVAAGKPVHAQIGSDRYASIVIDAGTGRVLSAVNADAPRHPASLTKMMTAYMVFEAVRNRRVTWSTPVVFSAHAAAQSPSKLGLPAGTRITLEEAALALITRSANDAAAAIAETLAGTEANFARLMTLRARSLGMTSTTFRNASGLPHPEQITTARDMAVLGLRLIQDFPTEYRLFSTTETRVRNLRLHNHNRMLLNYEGADGIKTGFIRASGFNLVASAVRDGRRLVGVVMGGASSAERDEHMADLLDQGFGASGVRVAQAGPPVALLPRARAETARPEPQRQAAARPPAPPPRQAAPPATWAVQVGAFSDRAGAHSAAVNARRTLGAGTVAVQQARVGNRTVWRARVTGLTEADARRLCAQRAKSRQECALIRPAGPAAAPPTGARRTAEASAAAPRG
ncbi:D-alanyl-D-alanine carboxypeptidase [Elioraea thermophila]|uniref:D-alanyl-D-alanine carboxypeptidase n=1 Tax=Elioraea thermophila TaxID=2185104 RepID=UPI000DF43C77|nr:D-alanyl-D-alanine carboxypeptidase [Elioraea thermophila]